MRIIRQQVEIHSRGSGGACEAERIPGTAGCETSRNYLDYGIVACPQLGSGSKPTDSSREISNREARWQADIDRRGARSFDVLK